MFEWIEKIYLKIDVAFTEFPKLKYISMFFAVLVILSAIFYFPILKLAHGFNYFGHYPLQKFIAENAGWLVWGQFFVPCMLAFFFYLYVSDLHDEKHIKKYGHLPKWIN